jgi:hypothetical protein
MGIKHISKDPLLSPIKGGSLLLILNNTQERTSKRKSKSITTPWV